MVKRLGIALVIVLTPVAFVVGGTKGYAEFLQANGVAYKDKFEYFWAFWMMLATGVALFEVWYVSENMKYWDWYKDLQRRFEWL